MSEERDHHVSAEVRQMLGLFDGPLGRILRERMNQIDKGFDHEHDEGHSVSELVDAATAYLWTAKGEKDGGVYWPWMDGFKPSEDDVLRDLEKAGALVCAAIEKVMRMRGLMEDDGV